MRKFIVSTATVIVMLTVASCGNKVGELQQQVDSLQTALLQSEGDYNRLNDYLSVISDGLDSISAQEQGLLVRTPESPMPSREDMKNGLKTLKNTLQEQRERIAKLEQDLSKGRGDVKKLQGIIAYLKEQIEAKDAQISDLLEQLDKSNMTVAQLTTRVGNLTQQNVLQEVKITEQEDVIQVQDQMLNEGYIKIGSKSELKNAGLLSGGFLKKKKVDFSQIDASQFQKVDIRQVTEIPIPSKSVKVLSAMPADSYRLDEDGKTTTLVITNPGRFWSVSSFLIIQTK